MKSSDWEKNIKNWENTRPFWIGKQPVFSCKIGKKKKITDTAASTTKNLRFTVMILSFPTDRSGQTV